MEERFSVPFEGGDLKGDILSVGAERSRVLVLHGAGGAQRKRYQELREFLLRHGLGSCAFDMIGHGETGGDMSSSSLEHRTLQALAVTQDQKLQAPLTLIGASMGAYTALKISEVHEVGKLILLVPGMYGREAYRLLFGTSFSKEIRKTDNWRESDAWDILSGYTGKLLIIGAEEDRTVPRELTQRIFDSAVKASKKELYFVPGAHHLLTQYLKENPAQSQVVLDKVLGFVA